MRIISLVLAALLVNLTLTPVKARIFDASQYLKLTSTSETSLELFLNKDDFSQNFNEKNSTLNFHIDASTLILEKFYPSSFKIEIYDTSVNPKRLLSIFRPTILSEKKASNLFIDIELENLTQSSNIQIDLYNSKDEYKASFTASIEIEGSDNVTYLDIADSQCTGDFGKCQLEYLLQNLKLTATPTSGIETKIEKNIDGTYTVNLPLSKTKKRIKVKNFVTESNGNPNPDDLDFEFDGTNLYVVRDGESILIGSQGPTGPTGPMGPAGPAGASGSLLMDTILLLPADANLPSVSPAIPDLGSNTHRILFDGNTDESVNWTNIKIKNYAGGALTANIGYSMTSSTSNAVIFNVEMWCVSDGDVTDIDSESYDVVNASTAITVPGTAGNLDVFTIPLTNTDSVTEGDVCAFRLTRDADNVADNAAGDAEVRYLEISE
jgi:hypothetical protein